MVWNFWRKKIFFSCKGGKGIPLIIFKTCLMKRVINENNKQTQTITNKNNKLKFKKL